MTTRRLSLDHPLASTGWPARPAPSATAKREAELEAIFRTNMARRDAAAAAYGEPETQHEFFHGRPGSQAEGIVMGCLQALKDIPAADRLFADQLMDDIARVYLNTAPATAVKRRAHAILEMCGEVI